MEGWVDLSNTNVNNLLKVIILTAVLVGIETTTSESLVWDLTTTPPSRTVARWLCLFEFIRQKDRYSNTIYKNMQTETERIQTK